MLHIFLDRFPPNEFFDLALRVHIERVFIKLRNLGLPLEICLIPTLTSLLQDLAELVWVVQCCDELWLGLECLNKRSLGEIGRAYFTYLVHEPRVA